MAPPHPITINRPKGRPASRPAAPANAPDRRRPSLSPRLRSYYGLYRAALRYPPYNLDDLTAQEGFDTADKMLTMAACRSPFNIKRYAIQADGWEIVPAVTNHNDARSGPAAEYATFMRWAVMNMRQPGGLPVDMHSVIFEVARGCWEGFRISEKLLTYIEEGPYAGLYGLRGFSHKICKQMGIDIDPATNELMYLTSYTPGGSVVPGPGGASNPQELKGGYDFEVPVESCLIYTYHPHANLTDAPGDWRGCYKHWFSLDNNMRFWNMALEKWGSPYLIATADTNNPQQMQSAQATLDAITRGASAILPKNISYEIAQANPQIFQAFQQKAEFDEQQIAKNIISNTLTVSQSTSGTNTNALGKEHGETSTTVFGFTRAGIEAAFERQVCQPLCALNFAGFDPELTPRLSLGGDETENILNLMQAFDLAIQDGVIYRGAAFIRDRLGWPPMDPEEEAQIAQEQQAQQEAQERIADARNSGQVGALDDAGVARAMARLQRALNARSYVEGAGA